ncbi:MAG: hypothetical protein A2509_03670 [Candidatus Edwardsbacteria bacterium RIFOXYD12_FULL_50_11]|uniref:Uncharacterized protein n=1 Tax=Candidatus Edwardsbacteria bacterium GWF2_54_11 TaxID=1817851 RepID=A0A1F5R7S5_9BACT|nr:MAG: hypothetical protein A2502_03585 [Candidatus Edwardsbacteria bacterium RifOxyC12_full_54_24]OGF07795.1 MAG: hypothetical protein A2273_04835 [Candidatus Edwardsbacteria bacterium RifOxyA12_full_54_48]OGF10043.1 MAG: hypothetical protein A3K15_11245 [Candidatus Edwardsbacteria bacterium GWE2_54_12]OGF10489.1 MAG: hypothetical protein A2024_09065 [Candidatus Edwardsbacteria bacterium GWF2_54_11]OGF14955.1 MAG: hypothetical protein A2509_03670 [Candidatus Edwardsbacteria bacterium RIFOXYD1
MKINIIFFSLQMLLFVNIAEIYAQQSKAALHNDKSTATSKSIENLCNTIPSMPEEGKIQAVINSFFMGIVLGDSDRVVAACRFSKEDKSKRQSLVKFTQLYKNVKSNEGKGSQYIEKPLWDLIWKVNKTINIKNNIQDIPVQIGFKTSPKKQIMVKVTKSGTLWYITDYQQIINFIEANRKIIKSINKDSRNEMQ